MNRLYLLKIKRCEGGGEDGGGGGGVKVTFTFAGTPANSY